MLKRVGTGLLLLALAVFMIAVQGWPLRITLLALMLMSITEMYHAFEHRGDHPAKWAGYAYCILAFLAQSFYGELNLPVFALISPAMFAIVIGVILAMIAVILRGKVDFDSLTATIFPMLYPGLFFSLIMPLQDLPGKLVPIIALIMTFFIASASDVFALVFGLKFGKHRLSPEISPKKSIEGSVAGLTSAILFAMAIPALANALRPVMAETVAQEALPPVWAFGILGLVAGILSQFGDLAASMVKRHCGVKDFGHLLPGHGGIMDRMDGVLLCGAACYAFFQLAGI